MTPVELGKIIVVGNGLQLSIVAMLEIWAYRKFRHYSFLVLLAGTILAFSCWCLLSLPRLTHSSISMARYQTGTALYLAYIPFSLGGFVSLLSALIRYWRVDSKGPDAALKQPFISDG